MFIEFIEGKLDEDTGKYVTDKTILINTAQIKQIRRCDKDPTVTSICVVDSRAIKVMLDYQVVREVLANARLV